MNPIAILLLVGVCLFAFQAVSFLFCLRWLSQSKKRRDKELAILDRERAEIVQLQRLVARDLSESRDIATNTLAKLKHIGAEAHAEWEEMTKKINTVLLDVEQNAEKLVESNLATMAKQRLALEKTCVEANTIQNALQDSLKKSQKLLKLFDTSVAPEQIIREIQQDKYREAKKMLANGFDASVISQTLKISMSEVLLLSSY